MRVGRAIAIAFLWLIVLILALVGYFIWYMFVPHHIATVRLGDHEARLKVEYRWDVAHEIKCDLRGPKWKHPLQDVAFIGAGESFPTFIVHHATNANVFWITPNTLTNIIIYALDADTGQHWSEFSGTDGQKFLTLANQQQPGYKLYGAEWIGVKK